MLITGTFWFGYAFFCLDTHQALQAAIAEADRTDPGWRWQDIVAKRPRLPDKENGALHLQAIGKLMPKREPLFYKTVKFPNERPIHKDHRERLVDKFEWALEELPPAVMLNDQQLSAIESELKARDAVLAEAYKMVNFSRGQYPHPPKSTPFTYYNASAYLVRDLSNLLALEAKLHAQKQRPEKALESARAMLHLGKILGAELDVVSPLVRFACCPMICASLERTLAQGQPDTDALKRIQTLLEETDREFPLLELARLERARFHRLFEDIKAGKAQMVPHVLGAKKKGPFSLVAFKYTWQLERLWAQTLLLQNDYVRAAKLPPAERPKALKKLYDERRREGWYSETILILFPRLGLASLRAQMKIRTARVALAVERYRLAKGEWPDKLANLVPNYLSEVPEDFYGSGTLRYRKKTDHVIIYSVGPDGADNEGRLDPEPNELITSDFAGLDFGFRLWNPADRRQPAQPPIRIPDSIQPLEKD